jgi:hypothetical protein
VVDDMELLNEDALAGKRPSSQLACFSLAKTTLFAGVPISL